MYKFGILAFLTGGGTTGLGKCGPLSHLESPFDSDIFLSFISFCNGMWNLILPLLFLFYQTHFEVTDQDHHLHKDLITSFAKSFFFSFAELSKYGRLRIGLQGMGIYPPLPYLHIDAYLNIR